MPDNFRHAQYRSDGTQIDDPQKLVEGAIGDASVSYDDVSDSAINADKINAALRTGMHVSLNYPGTVWLSKPIRMPSNSQLSVAPKTVLKLVTNAKCAIIRNVDAQNALPVSGMTIVGTTVTLTERGHDYKVGDTVYVEGCLTNLTLNGPKVITAITATTWSFTGSGALPTNTNEQRIMTSVYNPRAGSSFVRASNIVTVTEPGHVRQQGDHVYIAGLGGANTFNGKAKIINVTQGVSWTYANTGVNETATGTANILGNTNIRLDLRYDGNRANQSGLDEWLDFPCQFINVGNMYVLAPAISNFWWRGLGFWNASEIDIPYCKFYNGSVGVQFDSFCDGIRVGSAAGYQMSDDVVAWGVTGQSGPFGETAPPSGPGNMGSLVVQEIDGDSPTGLFKHYCFTGYDLGRVKIGTLRGIGRGISTDGSLGVSGGTITSLLVERFEATPSADGQTGIALGGVASYGDVIINGAVDAYSSRTGCFMVNCSVPINKLQIYGYTSDTYTSSTNPAIQINTGSDIKDLSIISSRMSSGQNNVGIAAVNVATGARVRSLTLRDCELRGFGTNGSGTFAGRGVQEAAGGRIDRVVLDNVWMNNGQLESVVNLSGGATRTDVELCNINQGYADDVTAGRPGSLVNDNGSAKSLFISMNNVHVRNAPNNVCQLSGSGTNRIKGSGIDIPTNKIALLSAGTHSTSIDCSEATVDLGASAAAPPARLVPLSGDSLNNSNAVGGGLYFRTAAGAWQAY